MTNSFKSHTCDAHKLERPNFYVMPFLISTTVSFQELMGQVGTGIPPAGSRRHVRTMEKRVAVALLKQKVRHIVSSVVLCFFFPRCRGAPEIPVWTRSQKAGPWSAITQSSHLR